MPKWNSKNARLQLLMTFQAVLEHKSVTAAADVLAMTQSAVSKHLKLLREWFDDELFVRTSKGMAPTPKAVMLSTHIHGILSDIETLGESIAFDPSQLHDNFIISTTDEIQAFLLPKLLSRLEQQAPDVRLTLKPLESDYAIRQLESGAVNLVISVNWHAPEQFKQRYLFADRFVCMMRKGHPLARQKLSLKTYSASQHMMVAPLAQQRGYIDTILEGTGYQRSVRLSVPQFMQVADILASTDLIITMPYRAAMLVQQSQALLIKELPFNVPTIDYYMFWHKRYQNDSASQWLRDLIYQILGKRNR